MIFILTQPDEKEGKGWGGRVGGAGRVDKGATILFDVASF